MAQELNQTKILLINKTWCEKYHVLSLSFGCTDHKKVFLKNKIHYKFNRAISPETKYTRLIRAIEEAQRNF